LSAQRKADLKTKYKAFLNAHKKRVMKQWTAGGLSNFEYLMHLNTLAGRSFHDLTQYPVFPWVIADYESEALDLHSPLTYRDLSKPMGALGAARAAQFRDRYEALEDIEQAALIERAEREEELRLQRGHHQHQHHHHHQSRESYYDGFDSDGEDFGGLIDSHHPNHHNSGGAAATSGGFNDDEDLPSIIRAFHYGTHYSCAGYVLHYLTRLEPYSRWALQLQGGKFDKPDRLFRDVRSSWRSASSENLQDVRELTPEFFCLPDFLVNANKFDFSSTQRGQKVDDVQVSE
jgi:hypothetical protein